MSKKAQPWQELNYFNSARSNLGVDLLYLPELFEIGKNFSDLDHFI